MCRQWRRCHSCRAAVACQQGWHLDSLSNTPGQHTVNLQGADPTRCTAFAGTGLAQHAIQVQLCLQPNAVRWQCRAMHNARAHDDRHRCCKQRMFAAAVYKIKAVYWCINSTRTTTALISPPSTSWQAGYPCTCCRTAARSACWA